MFNNLDTLSLGEWCMVPDFSALSTILEKSPNVERLYLHLDMVCVLTCLKKSLLGVPKYVIDPLNHCFRSTEEEGTSIQVEDHLLATT